jgi:1,4-dihydroxy-2-naphthoyl-CoA synthase
VACSSGMASNVIRQASSWFRAAQRWNGLPRLVGRSRALEIVLSCNDLDADIAERYGWVNRTLDDNDLDSLSIRSSGVWPRSTVKR